jgi:hypothetical protein
LNATALAPVKFVPVIVTVVPGAPETGENEVIVGVPPVTANELELVALPDGVVTVSAPVVAPEGTAVWICVAEMTLNTAAVPLNATPVAPVNAVPVIVTVVPGVPEVGVNELIVGAGGGGGGELTVKLDELTAVPAGVVTAIAPDDAFCGTVAVICVSEVTANVALAPLKVTPVAPVKFEPLIVTDDPG